MDSILNTRKGTCFHCGRHGFTEQHHIFFGSGRRAISDKEGLTVYLCSDCHRGDDGVHGKFGEPLNTELKVLAQRTWEARYKTTYPYNNHADKAAREAFVRLMGKNYILEDEE